MSDPGSSLAVLAANQLTLNEALLIKSMFFRAREAVQQGMRGPLEIADKVGGSETPARLVFMAVKLALDEVKAKGES